MTLTVLQEVTVLFQFTQAVLKKLLKEFNSAEGENTISVVAAASPAHASEAANKGVST